MKNVLRLLAFAALVTVFALPSYAQNAAAPAQTPAPTPAAADPCTADADAKAALYKKFTDNFKGTPDKQKLAYEAGKEYISKYGNCPGDASQVAYIQNKFVTPYEKATLEFNCNKAVNDTPATAFQACQPWVAANPENVKTYLWLVTAGLKNVTAKNDSTNAEAANAARRALALLEQGKTTDVWQPYASQAEAAPGLNYHVGFFTLKNSPAEAATYLLKAAQSNSTYAKEPTTYDYLAAAYINSELKSLVNEYKAKYEGKEATPESEALLNKVNAVTHRIVDAYARAVALTPAGPLKDTRKVNLVTFYKQLHDGKEDGLNELLAGILAKPIMLPGQEPPPPPPATSTADGANGAGGATTTTTTPAAGTTTARPAVTPTPKPAAQKPPRS
jgi:hypothetical protein